jgi:uncharacterized membrane protein
MEADDLTALTTDIAGIGTDIGTIGVAVLAVVVVFLTFRWASRALGLR